MPQDMPESVPVAQQPLQQEEQAAKTLCPHCGAAIDADADYCEACRSYIKEDVCSFCGAHVAADAAFCSECGCPKVGIVCPVCRTVNKFAFCKQCGTPLTEGAKALVQELKRNPQYLEMAELSRELGELDKVLPYQSVKDKEGERATEELLKRVLRLLAEDAGTEPKEHGAPGMTRMTTAELETRKAGIMAQISSLLGQVATTHMVSPVKARNYAMACKPMGVRVAWKCNYKNALHNSPCGCAKPQMGGRWIVLGIGSGENITEDN